MAGLTLTGLCGGPPAAAGIPGSPIAQEGCLMLLLLPEQMRSRSCPGSLTSAGLAAQGPSDESQPSLRHWVVGKRGSESEVGVQAVALLLNRAGYLFPYL